VLYLYIITIFAVFSVLCIIYGNQISSTAKEIIIFSLGVLAGFLNPNNFASLTHHKEKES